ncbi:MAG: transcriptional regulator [Candidatus Lokiarchaeota archaeon]|nr:transcriptional regulator [Candidatus Lokiarchaeota archaeon]
MSCLYVVDEEDFLFLKNQTGLSDGNLSSHLSKLEERNYITIKKEFIGKKPHTMLKLTKEGISAFEAYRKKMSQFLSKGMRKKR